MKGVEMNTSPNYLTSEKPSEKTSQELAGLRRHNTLEATSLNFNKANSTAVLQL